MIWLKVSVFTSMQMEANMWDTGIKINSTVSEKKSGMIIPNIKDFIKMHQKRVKENTAGLMETDTLENGQIICSTVKDFSCGMMIGYFSETGRII
jgi:hypothetical protein